MISLADRLSAAVDRGLIGSGEAHRMAVLARLRADVSSPEARSEDTPGGHAVVSGEALAKDLGLSRAAVHKHVEHLRSLGVAVESVGGAGYRLAGDLADLIVPEAVVPLLLAEQAEPVEPVEPAPDRIAGLPYRYQARCASTNLVLRQTAASSLSGTVVATDEQTGGRGRLGRTWTSEPGKDLTFSVLLRPALAPAQAHLLSLAAGVAVAETIEEVTGAVGRVTVKWPNDVLLENKKVCGILLEGSMDADRLLWAIAGIGLNVNSAPSLMPGRLDQAQAADWVGKSRPVSLKEHLGREVSRAPLLAGLLRRLAARWAAVGDAGLLDDLEARDALRGRRVEVSVGAPGGTPVVTGRAMGMGPEGQLLVQGDDGVTVPVFAGEVTVRDVEVATG